MERDRATVQDVARLAGVSPMTVSRVLNKSQVVRPETAARVRAAMVEAGYRRNDAARNLRSRRSVRTIGLVVNSLPNPFYAAVGNAVERVAAEHDAMLVISSGRVDPAEQQNVVETLLDRGLDGILIYPTVDSFGFLVDNPVESRPVVFLGSKPQGLDVDAVVIDHVGAAERAVRQLIAYGHRRIGVIGPIHAEAFDAGSLDEPTYLDHGTGRFAGYRKALAAAGIEYDPRLVRAGQGTVAETRGAVRDLMDQAEPPTALFTLNNRITVGVLEELGSGLANLALIGFGDFDLASVVDPPVTVVALDPAEMGRRGAELLLSRIEGRDFPPRTIVLPTVLIGRGSGERAPRS